MASLPHFHQADEEYINAIDGMKPDGKQHDTFVDIEPVSFYWFYICIGPEMCDKIMKMWPYISGCLKIDIY